MTSFARQLRAVNLTPSTQRTYLDSLDRLATFLESRGMPTDVGAIKRDHLEAFIEDQLARWKPTTAANRYSGIRPLLRVAGRGGRNQGQPNGADAEAEAT